MVKDFSDNDHPVEGGQYRNRGDLITVVAIGRDEDNPEMEVIAIRFDNPSLHDPRLCSVNVWPASFWQSAAFCDPELIRVDESILKSEERARGIYFNGSHCTVFKRGDIVSLEFQFPIDVVPSNPTIEH